MKKHSSSTLQAWFKSKSHKQIAFTSSVILIGILFIIAVVSILVKKGPSADVVTSPVGRLAKRVTISNGQVSFNSKTKPTNNVDVRIKSIPGATFALEGFEKANQVTKLPTASITVKTTAGAKILDTPLAATATAGLNATQIKSSFDSDEYRNKVNQTNADLKITIAVPGYLKQTVTRSDPKSALFTTPLLAGNFTNAGDSNNVIDEADASVCGPNFKVPVSDTNKICDMNYDGVIDEADSSIWGPNFMKRGSSE